MVTIPVLVSHEALCQWPDTKQENASKQNAGNQTMEATHDKNHLNSVLYYILGGCLMIEALMVGKRSLCKLYEKRRIGPAQIDGGNNDGFTGIYLVKISENKEQNPAKEEPFTDITQIDMNKKHKGKKYYN